MSDWTASELEQVGKADELQVASLGPDGAPRRYVTIWVVRVGDDLYVRSYKGRSGGWFRSAVRDHQGHIKAGGVERDVTFEEAGDASQAAIDQAYQAKYAQYGSAYVDPMVRPDATAATLRLVAR
jgi:hypothetical protein